MAGKLVLQGFVGRPGADHLRDSALDLAEFASDLPRRLDRILGDIERGNLRVWTRIEDFDALLKRVEPSGCPHQRRDTRRCVHHRAGHGHSILPSSRMGRVDRHSVLACCYGCCGWLH
jgi:hypothetical protein